MVDWWWILIGLTIGGMGGMLVLSLLVASAKGDEQIERTKQCHCSSEDLSRRIGDRHHPHVG